MDDLQIRVIACRRSGHHAVIDWMADCLGATGKTVTFWNDCYPGRDPSNPQNRGAPDEERNADISPEQRDVLIYNYEDVPFVDVLSGQAVSESAGRCVDLFVFRDPFNQAASGMASAGLEKTTRVHSVWRKQVREARRPLPDDNTLREKMVLSYNMWLRPSFRRFYRSVLRLGPHAVEPTGGTNSSFDNEDEGYRDRWKKFRGDTDFWSIFEPLDIDRARAATGDEGVVEEVKARGHIPLPSTGHRQCRSCGHVYVGGCTCPQCGGRSMSTAEQELENEYFRRLCQ